MCLAMARGAPLWRAATAICRGRSVRGLPRITAIGAKSFSVDASSRTDLIKTLRERTGAPIKDVKEVLVKCEWNEENAFTELRKKGLAAATKKSSRVAAEGLLGLAHFEKGAAVIEINSETDFVARNDLFQSLVLSVAKAASTLKAVQQFSSKPAALDLHDLELVNVKLDHASITRELRVRDAVSEVAAITGENVRLRRAFYISSQRGIVSSYLHMSPASGLSRLAGLVSLEVEHDQEGSHSETLKSLGSSLAMHVVAARPLFLSKELVDSEVLEHERNICKAQASTAGKPENVVQKMVEGRLAKYMEEVVLLEQKYVADETKRINVLLKETSKEIGKTAKIEGFLRIEVGEGIEKLEKDFAAEVAAAAR
ncbi:elongation factor Ts, mitochondrial [Selaginella moellendorffii]|uniref:elongation factor Ts, mitochondrial n=1 Tax=Selaginella moellendorffii TaxID=88036 RepID=UPI000D1CB0DD|nr:elongation factor Ts, mitochondrial [Selaginella moellendorffii]|eukprot:XP_024535210.1 elongation factor Ts, mitochondrial [Selaginella moellendorffii]